MPKTESELRREFDRYSVRESFGAWIIVAALILEAAVVWRFSEGKSGIETVSFVFVDLAIATGVYLEIHFGRKASAIGAELQRRDLYTCLTQPEKYGSVSKSKETPHVTEFR